MYTLLCIIIGFALRKRYIPEDSNLGVRLFYYALNIVLTPLLGIYLFKKIMKADENRSPYYENRGDIMNIFPS